MLCMMIVEKKFPSFLRYLTLSSRFTLDLSLYVTWICFAKRLKVLPPKGKWEKETSKKARKILGQTPHFREGKFAVARPLMPLLLTLSSSTNIGKLGQTIGDTGVNMQFEIFSVAGKELENFWREKKKPEGRKFEGTSRVSHEMASS